MAYDYDAQIKRLAERPEQIMADWGSSEGLFQAACRNKSDCLCGCLTQVRCGLWPAETAELTKAIRADGRLPYNGCCIKVEHLPVFKEWQERLDRELWE